MISWLHRMIVRPTLIKKCARCVMRHIHEAAQAAENAGSIEMGGVPEAWRHAAVRLSTEDVRLECEYTECDDAALPCNMCTDGVSYSRYAAGLYNGVDLSWLVSNNSITLFSYETRLVFCQEFRSRTHRLPLTIRFTALARDFVIVHINCISGSS